MLIFRALHAVVHPYRATKSAVKRSVKRAVVPASIRRAEHDIFTIRHPIKATMYSAPPRRYRGKNGGTPKTESTSAASPAKAKPTAEELVIETLIDNGFSEADETTVILRPSSRYLERIDALDDLEGWILVIMAVVSLAEHGDSPDTNSIAILDRDKNKTLMVVGVNDPNFPDLVKRIDEQGMLVTRKPVGLQNVPRELRLYLRPVK